MGNYIDNCKCYIHSLQKDGKHVLGTANIVERIGDNRYIAEVDGVKCTAVYNPFAGRYFVDDVYGVIRDTKAPAHSR